MDSARLNIKAEAQVQAQHASPRRGKRAVELVWKAKVTAVKRQSVTRNHLRRPKPFRLPCFDRKGGKGTEAAAATGGELSNRNHPILVFDTDKEEFSWKSPPPVRDREMRLLEFPTCDLRLSVSRKNKATLELWCLEDYQNKVWVLVHRIQLALQQMPVLQDEDLRIPALAVAL